MAQRLEHMQKPITITHGHSDTQVVLLFSTAAVNVYLTPDECRSMIKNLEENLAKLEAH